jgi:hypothetical protein
MILLRSNRVVDSLILACFLLPGWLSAQPGKVAARAEYLRYIEPLLEVADFRTHYVEDGAADATVLFPESNQPPYDYLMPPAPVTALVRLGAKSIPLLIDCLSDTRITNMRFEGNRITQAMNVPLGYVCLDILMNEVSGKPVSDPSCADDGLGACMNYGFYFRPDDYYACTDKDCMLRPWISVVKRNWKNEYLAHRLRFHNPYNSLPVEEYKALRTVSN